MHDITYLRPKPKLQDVDCFGGCPRCWRNDGYINIDGEHWFVCHRHRTKWLVGVNLFSDWIHKSENELIAGAARIRVYRKVDPICPPPESLVSTEGP